MELGTAQKPLTTTGLRLVMTNQGRQWQWLAAALRVHPSTVLRWSKGNATSHYLCRIDEIAELLDVDPALLT